MDRERPGLTIDLAELAGRFGHALHAAGVPVDPGSSGRFAAALAVARPERVDGLYWLARVTLAPGRPHVGRFDAVFDQVFRGWRDVGDVDRNVDVPAAARRRAEDRRAAPPSQGRQRDHAGDPDRPSLSAGEGTGDGDSTTIATPATASAAERLRHQPFDQCTAAELDQLRALMGQLVIDPPQRRSRRSRAAATGREIDRRATLRLARRHGGDPVRLVRRHRRTRQRRVVLIADVSGSMEAYGRAYLYLLHGAVRALRAEAFVFATRLHRLTRPLRASEPSAALAAAMAATPEWAGGTKLGESIKAFNDGWARRGLARGAVVVIVSDGWESGDPRLLGQEMQRLSRLAHRIVWVNPRRQSAQYRPLTGGMAAARPHVDTFVSGHSFAALVEVIDAIRE